MPGFLFAFAESHHKCEREFAVLTQKFSGENGKVQKLHCVRVDDKFKPIAGTEFALDAQLVLLAMGFVHPVHEGMLKTLGVDFDQRGNARARFFEFRSAPQSAAMPLYAQHKNPDGSRNVLRPVSGPMVSCILSYDSTNVEI
ncbi:NADPH-dependent glutamate synthase beta subunit-like oxidoreductase [Bradyrhizobium sp. AZCC 1678]